MSIYAISDLHLSFGKNKPMNIFGDKWENHFKKIEEDWVKNVKEDDVVLMPGDFSWAMYLEDTYEDFRYLNKLPGIKIILKGNHDYWWTTVKKMNEYLEQNDFKNIMFLYNNSYCHENKIIVGTRGWSEQEEKAEKIMKRENNRLELSIKDGINKYGENKEIIVCMHYPPFNSYEELDKNFILTMKKYNVTKCIYGHVHGEAINEAIEGKIDNIEFKLVSCDKMDFKLYKIV
ncbi:MAG: serine/threonine protein phosphatase [Clostridiales bacterium]|nr:serine/threonine protein phosphatase [Clostridiales bacterium]